MKIEIVKFWFSIFFPGGRVRPRTLSYLLSAHSILSFYANPNTDICQWSKQFYLQYPFVMNKYFGAFRYFKWQEWSIVSSSFGSLPSLEVCPGYPKFSKKVLRLWYPRADVPGYTLKGVYYHAQIEERVSMVDKKNVDSLLLIPQSPLVVEDFFIKTKDEKLSVFLFVCLFVFYFLKKRKNYSQHLSFFSFFLLKLNYGKLGDRYAIFQFFHFLNKMVRINMIFLFFCFSIFWEKRQNRKMI